MSLEHIFENVTTAAGILFKGRTHGAAWADFNGDRYPDLFIGNHDSAVGNNEPNAVILYENQRDGTFVDVASIAIDVYGQLVGSDSHDLHTQAWVDFDNDGDPDLVLPEHSRRLPDRFLVNEDGFLRDQAGALNFTYSGVSSQGQVFFDYDRDGLIDLFVASNTAAFPSVIFHQTHDGVFENLGSLIFPEDILTTYGILGDLSGDGNLDLIIGGGRLVYDLTTAPFTDLTDALFANGGRNATDAVAADFNGDLLVDLYQTRNGYGFTDVNQTSSTSLDLNIARPTNAEVGIAFLTSGTITIDLLERDFQNTLTDIYIGANGFNPTQTEFTLDPANPDIVGILPHAAGVDSGLFIGYDPSLQRWQVLASHETLLELSLDITSSESISGLESIGFDVNQPPSRDRLFLNSPAGLEDVTLDAGIGDLPIYGRSVIAGDFDNDMDLDLFIVANKGITNVPDILLENDGHGHFSAVPNAGGAPGPEPSVGIGDSVVAADYDLDGFLDLFVTNGWRPREFVADGPYQLYTNRGNQNHWLQIDLQGVQSNRDGIGAQVLTTAGGVTQLREQNGGFHVESQNFQRLHFGLGSNIRVDVLEIRWPSGIVQRIQNVAADQLLTVVETNISGVTIYGSSANDVLNGTEMDDILNGLEGDDLLAADAGNDTLSGDAGRDKLKGGTGADWLVGGDGDDSLFGEQGDDTLAGGLGQDVLMGGWNDDVFDYNDVAESPGGAGDIIQFFNRNSGDRIDFSDITGGLGSFIGTGNFTGAIGQVRWQQNGADALIQLDIDGNNLADLEITLLQPNGLVDGSDFIF